MDALVKLPPKQRFLPAVAEQVGIWFPELGGRSLAVSEVSITKANVPTLPLAMVCYLRGTANPPMNADMFEITDIFLVDFWLEPERYKRANGTETPFWSYYDYESIRNKLLAKIAAWETPGGERIVYRELVIDAEELAVTLTFRFTATFRWCAPKTNFGDQLIKEIDFNLCTPSECCLPEEVDPCR